MCQDLILDWQTSLPRCSGVKPPSHKTAWSRSRDFTRRGFLRCADASFTLLRRLCPWMNVGRVPREARRAEWGILLREGFALRRRRSTKRRHGLCPWGSTGSLLKMVRLICYAGFFWFFSRAFGGNILHRSLPSRFCSYSSFPKKNHKIEFQIGS